MLNLFAKALDYFVFSIFVHTYSYICVRTPAIATCIIYGELSPQVKSYDPLIICRLPEAFHFVSAISLSLLGYPHQLFS